MEKSFEKNFKPFWIFNLFDIIKTLKSCTSHKLPNEIQLSDSSQSKYFEQVKNRYYDHRTRFEIIRNT